MNKTVAEMPVMRICRPAKPTAPCGEMRKCVPDDAGATALVQPFPSEKPLFDNLDLPKPDLERQIGGLSGKVRSYKMISVWPDDIGQLQQHGSGPNFQGGCLTLCTCRHEIRAEKVNPQEWRGWWFAGFTSPKICGRVWLFYLARMEAVYASQAELWEALPASVRQAKSTRRNRLGDVYQPNPASPCVDPWNAAHYHPPLVGHSHHETATDDTWKKDIEFYHSKFKRRAPYLLAKPQQTFLWQTPMLFLDEHPRNLTWDNVKALLLKLNMDRVIMADNNPLLESFYTLFGKKGGDVLPGNVGMSRTVICTCRDLMALDTPLVYDYFDAWDKREAGRRPLDTELHLVGNGQWEGAWALAQLHYEQQLKQEAKQKSRLHKGHPLCNLAIVGRVIGSSSLARHYALLSSAGDVYWEHVLHDLRIGGLGPTLLEQFESTIRQDAWRETTRTQASLADKNKPVYLEAFLAARWFSDSHAQHFFNLAGVEQGGGKPFVDVLLAAVDDPKGASTTTTGTRFEAAAGLVMSCTPGFEVDSARKTTDEQIDFVVRYTEDPLSQLGFDLGFGLVECKSSASPVSVSELRDFGAKCLFHRVKFGVLVARSGITGDTFAEPQMAELVRRRFQADGVTILVLQGRHLRGKTCLLRGVQDELCADHRFLAFGPIA